MITDPDKIGRNLREVELFMFDDPDIKDDIYQFKQDLHNDHTLLNISAHEGTDYSYPVIKNRFDDVDSESIPHHWKNIDPLLYHLVIWAIFKVIKGYKSLI